MSDKLQSQSRNSKDVLPPELIAVRLHQIAGGDLPFNGYAKGILLKAAAALAVSETKEWIKCSDRMPSVHAEYLCWFQMGFAVLDYSPKVGWYWGDGTNMNPKMAADITHWKELEAPNA